MSQQHWIHRRSGVAWTRAARALLVGFVVLMGVTHSDALGQARRPFSIPSHRGEGPPPRSGTPAKSLIQRLGLQTPSRSSLPFTSVRFAGGQEELPPQAEVSSEGPSIEIDLNSVAVETGDEWTADESLFYDQYYTCWRFRGEFLYWWTNGNTTPPLVTTSPMGTPRDDAGVLGLPTTSVVFGGGTLNEDGRVGGRLLVGYNISPCWTVEAEYLGLEKQKTDFNSQSSGNPIIGRPFYNVTTGQPDALLLAFPGVTEGRISIHDSNEFDLFDVMARRRLFLTSPHRLDLLLGYRYARLRDRLRIDDFLLSQDIASGVAPGTTATTFDEFNTDNEFNGVLLGVMGEINRCNTRLDLWMKVALGRTRGRADINGSTRFVDTGGAVSSGPGGLLAVPSNIGSYSQDDFTVIPELGLRLNYDICCNLRASFGYTLIYWSRVLRSGDQIDTDINTTQLPNGTLTGAPLPEYTAVTNHFWAHGLSAGLEYEY